VAPLGALARLKKAVLAKDLLGVFLFTHPFLLYMTLYISLDMKRLVHRLRENAALSQPVHRTVTYCE